MPTTKIITITHSKFINVTEISVHKNSSPVKICQTGHGPKFPTKIQTGLSTNLSDIPKHMEHSKQTILQ